MNKFSEINDIIYSEEMKKLGNLIKLVVKKSIPIDSIKNLKRDDIGKNFSIFQEIKISFDNFAGWEGSFPKDEKGFYINDDSSKETSGSFMIFIPRKFEIGSPFEEHDDSFEYFAVDLWRKASETLYSVYFDKEEKSYFDCVDPAGLLWYGGSLKKTQRGFYPCNLEDEFELIEEDIKKLLTLCKVYRIV